MTPHVGGVPSRTARIRRAGVQCKRMPVIKKAKLMVLTLMAAIRSSDALKYIARYAAPRPNAATFSEGECSSRSPGVIDLLIDLLVDSPVDWPWHSFSMTRGASLTPSCVAVRARSPDGVYSHTTRLTSAISTATETRLCQVKIVARSGMTPPGTTPPAATISRIFGWTAPGVAIWRAADPESPCAQTLPRPRKLDAARAR